MPPSIGKPLPYDAPQPLRTICLSTARCVGGL